MNHLPMQHGAANGPQPHTLILGDENFTFTPSFMAENPTVPIEVAACLPEAKIPNEFRQNLAKLQSRGVMIHFGVNPAMLRQHFGMTETYQRLLFVLPGIGFQGCPQFVSKQTDLLFKLRLHLYLFGFVKSSQQMLQDGSVVQILWPNQDADPTSLRGLPWQPVDIEKLAPFCKVLRSEADDEILNPRYAMSWRPLIHNIPTLKFPEYLRHCKLYSWRIKHNYDATQAAMLFGGHGGEDSNMLRIPSHIFECSREILPHVNDLFHFELKTNSGELHTVSKLSVKYDPRISGWKGGGASTAQGAGKRGGSAGVPPPPPVPGAALGAASAVSQTASSAATGFQQPTATPAMLPQQQQHPQFNSTIQQQPYAPPTFDVSSSVPFPQSSAASSSASSSTVAVAPSNVYGDLSQPLQYGAAPSLNHGMPAAQQLGPATVEYDASGMPIHHHFQQQMVTDQTSGAHLLQGASGVYGVQQLPHLHPQPQQQQQVYNYESNMNHQQQQQMPAAGMYAPPTQQQPVPAAATGPNAEPVGAADYGGMMMMQQQVSGMPGVSNMGSSLSGEMLQQQQMYNSGGAGHQMIAAESGWSAPGAQQPHMPSSSTTPPASSSDAYGQQQHGSGRDEGGGSRGRRWREGDGRDRDAGRDEWRKSSQREGGSSSISDSGDDLSGGTGRGRRRSRDGRGESSRHEKSPKEERYRRSRKEPHGDDYHRGTTPAEGGSASSQPRHSERSPTSHRSSPRGRKDSSRDERGSSRQQRSRSREGRSPITSSYRGGHRRGSQGGGGGRSRSRGRDRDRPGGGCDRQAEKYHASSGSSATGGSRRRSSRSKGRGESSRSPGAAVPPVGAVNSSGTATTEWSSSTGIGGRESSSSSSSFYRSSGGGGRYEGGSGGLGRGGGEGSEARRDGGSFQNATRKGDNSERNESQRRDAGKGMSTSNRGGWQGSSEPSRWEANSSRNQIAGAGGLNGMPSSTSGGGRAGQGGGREQVGGSTGGMKGNGCGGGWAQQQTMRRNGPFPSSTASGGGHRRGGETDEGWSRGVGTDARRRW